MARGRSGVRGAARIAVALALCSPTARADDGNLATEPIAPQVNVVPARPRPLLELGNPFLRPGELRHGFAIPGGARWQPTLLVFGTIRTALQTFGTSDQPTDEWANRLDLFVNVNLTGTERILIGFRPLGEQGVDGGYRFGDDTDAGWNDSWNARVETAFFEGDLGELVPALDASDRRPLDIGFAVGRQPLFFQEGLLIEDSIDAFGLTRNTLRPNGSSNVRFTGIVGWGDLHRADGAADETATLWGIFSELDLPTSTVAVDVAVVTAGAETGDSLHVGVSSVQRIGLLNTAFRVVGSTPFRSHTTGADAGALIMAELSHTPGATHDLVYGNAFVGLGRYTPAARDPLAGGVLGRAGILFEGAAIGHFGAALEPELEDLLGGAIGWQKLFADGRAQLVTEVAAVREPDALLGGLGVRFQRALGRRLLARLDGFVSFHQHEQTRIGGRLELAVKF